LPTKCEDKAFEQRLWLKIWARKW